MLSSRQSGRPQAATMGRCKACRYLGPFLNVVPLGEENIFALDNSASPCLRSSPICCFFFASPRSLVDLNLCMVGKWDDVSNNSHLYTLQRRRLLEFPLDLATGIILPTLTVQTQQRTEVEFGGLQQLDLPNMYVLQRVDALAGLFNLAPDDLRDEFAGELGQGHGGGFPLDDLGHLLADGADLRGRGVGGLLDLVGPSLGEGDGEQADQVVIGGLDRHVGFDQGLPFAHQRPQLVRGEV